jgi:hypothetical protein
MTALNMDQGLISNKGSRVSLETTWKRYTIITKAISKVSDTEWETGKKPTDGEIIGIYSSKSVYYDQAKVLQHVPRYPEMVEWLERSDMDQVDETTSLWGFYKVAFTLKDLEKWLDLKQREVRSDRKGKKKATVKPRSQKGKRNDDGDGEDSTSPTPKKSHKKSVGGRKQ